jgi:hypothetical protein
MLVYGDVETTRDASVLHAEILDRLAALATAPPDLARHSALVSAFLGAGDLVGALIDREGPDDLSDTATIGMAALATLARCVDASWTCGSFAGLDAAAAALRQLHPAGSIRTKPAEGYAFYALYPESYAEAARRSSLSPQTRVLGIRSIGTTLSAMVAAALGAEPPITVRPTGHPFDRRLDLSPRLATEILAGNPAAFAIVDEGPGLSGSSFGAVMDWLTANGVSRDRIHLFPSHLNGPGTEAGAVRRAQWQAAAKHIVLFDELLLTGRLEGWAADLIGPLVAPLRDLSGGAWRTLTGSTAPVAPQWEKRKFLAESSSGRWLLKFTGLGPMAEHKLALARQLQAAGFGPEVAGLCHGFLVQRWVDAPNLLASPLPPDSLIPQLAAYLAFRSTLSAPTDAGAPTATLIEMATYNTGQALGEAAATAIAHRLARTRPQSPPPRVHVDGRLHAWEWLVANGRLLKTDALDHAMAHDFIGAQPIAWDLAGAIVEHDLTDAAAEHLIRAFEAATSTRVDRQSLDFYACCYLSFQLGAWTMSTGPDAPATTRYRDRLAALLGV